MTNDTTETAATLHQKVTENVDRFCSGAISYDEFSVRNHALHARAAALGLTAGVGDLMRRALNGAGQPLVTRVGL